MLKGSGGFQIPLTGLAIILGLVGTLMVFLLFIGSQGRIIDVHVRTSQSTFTAVDGAHALARCFAGADGVIEAELLTTHKGQEADDLLVELCGIRVGRELLVGETGLDLKARVVDFWSKEQWEFDYDKDESAYGTHSMFVAIKQADGVHIGRLDVEARV